MSQHMCDDHHVTSNADGHGNHDTQVCEGCTPKNNSASLLSFDARQLRTLALSSRTADKDVQDAGQTGNEL